MVGSETPLPAKTANWTDRAEAGVFILLYLVLVFRFIWSFVAVPNIIDALYVFDSTILIVFVLMRREASSMTRRPLDYGVAWAGTIIPLLAMPPSSTPFAPPLVCIIMVLLGIATHLSAKLSLRRSFGIVAADRGIKAGGAYRYVRHPMYLGYMLVQGGVLLAGPVIWNVVLFGVNWVLLFCRIQAEERLLLHNEDYQALCRETRFRLIPGIY